jgi:outer membrane protein assembly factor BamB
VRWRFEVGGYISSSPAIAKDGTIYVTSGDSIVALRDNKLKWKKSFGGKVYLTPSLGEDGTIYIGSDDNKVYALNPDGSLKWFFTAGGMVSSCVVVGRNGKLYFGCADNHTYILSSDGTLERKLPIGGMLLGATVDNDGTLYFGILVSSENGIERGRILYALSSEGEVKWSVELPAPLPPVLAADGTIYVGTLEGLLHAYGRDGSPRWKEPVKLGQAMYSPPALAQDGTIYACYSDNANLSWLVALTSAGEKKWQLLVGSFCRSTPAIDGRGMVYMGGDNLMAIAPDGVIRWQVSVGTKWASAAIAEDGSICAGTGGYLYVIGRGRGMNILYVIVAAVMVLALVFVLHKLRG